MATTRQPSILVIWGDDIGWWNISFNSRGQMGYRTPNIDRIAAEGVAFTDYYGQQSCTAGRAAFILGQNPIRPGLTKVGMPGADLGLRAEDPTIAQLLKHGRVRRARLGLAGQNIILPRRMVRHYGLEHEAAVQVASIESGGPASRAGFEQGDIIVEFAGQPVAGFDDLHRLLTGERLGERVAVTVLRRGRRLTLHTALDEAR